MASRKESKIPVTIPEVARETLTDDQICDRMLAAFDGGHEYLNDRDLLKVAGVDRNKYIQLRDYLLEETYELVEYEGSDLNAFVVYGRPELTAAADKD
jgi:hypothetical protein